MDFKLFCKCSACGKNRFYVAKRTVKLLNLNLTATSKGYICGWCFNSRTKKTIEQDICQTN